MTTETTASTSAYLALALVVLRFKPASSGVEDYIIALRCSIRGCNLEKKNTALSQPSTFWKRLFDPTQLDNLHLRAQIGSQRNGKQVCKYDSSGIDQTVIRKRSYSPENPERDAPSKRIKALEWEDVPMHVGPLLPQVKQHQDRSSALRVIFSLAHKKQTGTVESEERYALCCLACDTITKLFRNADDTQTELRAPVDQPLTLHEVSMASKKIWSLLITRMRDDPDLFANQKGRGDYFSASLSSLIRSLLIRLHQYASDEASQRNKIATSRERTTAEVKPTDHTDEKSTLYEHNSEIVTSFLVHCLYFANCIYESHPDTYDSVAVTFLQRLGSVMSFLLFHDNKCGDLVPSLFPLHGLVNAACIGGKVATLAAQLEAPRLLTILRGFMGQTLTLKEKSGPTSRALAKLQKILLNSIFHEQIAIGKIDSSTQHLIKSPHCDSDTTSNDGMYMYDNTELFLSQVWDILGWDILMTEAGNNENYWTA